jgi:electron transfer flavoprotein beta subunit
VEVLLKIVACIKQVPDTAANVIVEDGKVDWSDAQLIINPWDEYAVEAALQIKEANGGTVTAVTIGSESARDALKHALAMGCDDALLINQTASLDTQGIAHILAAVINKIGEVELIFFGRETTDGNSGLVGAQTARLLGAASLSLAAAIKLEGNVIHAERVIEEGRQNVAAKLPAVVSITKDFGEARYPSFMGIRKASRAVIPVWQLTELGLEPSAPIISTLEVFNPPTRQTTCEMINGAPEEIANKLADLILAEKIL